MKDDLEITPGERSAQELALREAWLTEGRVPLGVGLRRGLLSLVRDPWLMLLNNLPGPLGLIMRRQYYRFTLGALGRGALIDPNVYLEGTGNIYLDDLCYIRRFAQLVAPEGYIRIGKRCHVMGRILGHAGVEIGDNVGVNGMVLSVSDSHRNGSRMGGPMIPPEQRNLWRGKIVIGNDAFIGNYSMVMPGVTIGEGAIVGPLTFVTKDVAPWTVVMGNPAQVVSQREPLRFT